MESSDVKPFSYVYASLVNFFLLLPILAFEILVIKYYKLIHVKILYGLKLFAGNYQVIVQFMFFILKICPEYTKISAQRNDIIKGKVINNS